MDRRAFIGVIAGGLAAPLTAHAQKAGRVPIVGVLVPGPRASPVAVASSDAIERGLRDLGWIPGQTIRLEYRYAGGRLDRLRELAAELLALRPDVIVARGQHATEAIRLLTADVPIVMAASGFDPVKSGLVSSLAKPGGNVTGLTLFARQLIGKQLELLKEAVPRLARVGILGSTPSAGDASERESLDTAAHSLGLVIHIAEVQGTEDLAQAFDAFRHARAGAMVVRADPFILESNQGRVVALAMKYWLPTVYWLRSYVISGGLMSYGTDLLEIQRRAATFVDKILKGTKPADLPVEQPTKFELVINLKTAKALGLTIPPSLLLRADEVIE